MNRADDLTQLLNRLSGERNVPADQLPSLVYAELRPAELVKLRYFAGLDRFSPA